MRQLTIPEAFLQPRSKLLSGRRCRKRLDEIDNARRQLVLRIEDLDAQARVVQLELNALAPISTVPDEILAMIFEAGTFQGRVLIDPLVGHLVSHVTRHWRRIALGTPRLWSTIMCSNVAKSPKVSFGKWTEQVAAFLSRSQSLPVNIYLTDFDREDLTEDFIQLIGAYMAQCRRLCIRRAHLGSLSRAAQYLSTKSAPLLQSLDLHFSHPEVLLNLLEPLFPLAPKLEAVQLDAVNMLTMHFCLPGLLSITTLELTNVNVDDAPTWNAFREVLMAFPLLAHLELEVSFYARSERLPMVLPTVRFLHLDASSCPTFLLSLIHLIQAASLETLSLEGWGPEDGSTEDTASDSEPELHFPSLRHLALADVTRQRPAIGVFARKFTDIERLSCNVSARDPLCDLEYIRTTVRRAQEIGDTEQDGSILNSDADSGCLRWPKLREIAVSRQLRPLYGLSSHAGIMVPWSVVSIAHIGNYMTCTLAE